MKIIGQDKLLNKIDKLTLDMFPRTLMLEGPRGSGKHIISEYISKHLNLSIINISESISLDLITSITLRVEPYIYLIEANKLTERTENVLLKFLEEPLKNSFIIVLCENKSNILETVINRCQVWKLEIYTEDVLSTFIQPSSIEEKDRILSVAKTPGQILTLKDLNLQNIFNLAEVIYSKIHNATLPNTLTLSDKIAFKGEPDKLDFEVFMNILLQTSLRRVREDHQGSFEAYNLTKKFFHKKKIKNVDKKYLFENFLVELRNEMQQVWTSKN